MVPPSMKANVKSPWAQLSQVMFLTKTRKCNWLHQCRGLTTPRICLSPHGKPHQLSAISIQILKRGGMEEQGGDHLPRGALGWLVPDQ